VPSPAPTRDRILDAAEVLFAERGFARASVRAITERAGANLAAVNYHFGSKLELIRAVLQRRFGPLNAERLRRLGICEGTPGCTLEEVVDAFIGPALSSVRSETHRATLSRLLGMAFSQPSEELREIVLDQFGPVIERFVAALDRLLPDLNRQQIYWRFHFMIGALGYSVALGGLVKSYSGGLCDPSKPETVRRQLLGFVAAGLRHAGGPP
jgi:AcrR family transcriptional regulator